MSRFTLEYTETFTLQLGSLTHALLTGLVYVTERLSD